MKFLTASAALLATSLVQASTAPSTPMQGEVLWRITGGLLLVVSLVFVAAWMVRRFVRLPGGNSGNLQLLGGLAVGQRERVVLIRAGDQQLLLGVAPGRVQMLHTITSSVGQQAAEHSNSESEEASSPFQEKLSRLLGRIAAQ